MDLVTCKKNKIIDLGKYLSYYLSLYFPQENSTHPLLQTIWQAKVAEVSAYQNNPQSLTPLIDAESKAAGIEKAALATKIFTKNQTWGIAIAKVQGVYTFHKSNINALTTNMEVSAYSFLTGWPEEEFRNYLNLPMDET